MKAYDLAFVPRTEIGPMFVFPNDMWVGRSFILYGEYAHSEMVLVSSLANRVALDIGANIGALTIPMARRAAYVYAFEPQPVVSSVLKANLAINNIPNVSVCVSAVGASNGTTGIPDVDYNEPDSNFGGVRCENNASTIVPLVTVDSMGLDNVGFVKIDVEGMEPQVLEGMTSTLSKCRPIVLMECDREEPGRSAIQKIRSMDYDLYWAITPLFRSDNFFNNQDNVFGSTVSFDVLCWPKEVPRPFNGLRAVQDDDPIGQCPSSWVVQIR